ncbi:MAG: hypothetical protein ACI9H8_001247 [Lysobacterales bacterium]|jgi:hypothetical protein
MGQQHLTQTEKRKNLSMRLYTLLLLFVCTNVLAQIDSDQLLQDRIKAHIEFLASDELRGREPGTEGYDIAANYVASQFRQMGLVPAGAEDSFFQQVPMRRSWPVEGSISMQFQNGDSVVDFEYVNEFYRGSSLAHEDSEIKADMIFVGYGIDAPELEYTDFEGIDLEGKIAVALAGQPLGFPSEEGAHFGSGAEKLKALAARGAIGSVTVYTPRTEKRFPWERIKNSVGKPGMGWLTASGDPFRSYPEIKGGAFIHYTPAVALFEDANHSLEALIEMDRTGQSLPVFPMKGTLSLSQKSRHETIYSPNVVALLPGTDPLLSNEYVVYTAHLDHVGELIGEGHKDAINNGALDNASGVAVMLETARLFKKMGGQRRSILFVAVTAEEKGLVGSEYFAQNPTVAEGSMVANINLDMPILLHEFADVIAFGAEHSSLGDTVRKAAETYGIKLSPDPMPEQNIFVRSDHYRFVQKGIPSIYLVTGVESLDGNQEEQDFAESFIKNHYHQVSDDLDLPINYNAAARFTQINARVGEIVANQSERPSWNEGDFFGTTFSR